MLSYYEILQINENASDAEIKRAYRKLCKILHPDLHNNNREANVIFNLLHEAYETLSDPVKKRNYNPTNQNKTNSFDVSFEKYDEIISGYKKIVKDYERIIKSKNQREMELLEEIRNLKEGTTNQSVRDDEIELEEAEEQTLNNKPNQDEGWSIWGIILLIVFILAVIGVIILIAMVPVEWWILIGIVALPIWLFISAFK